MFAANTFSFLPLLKLHILVVLICASVCTAQESDQGVDTSAADLVSVPAPSKDSATSASSLDMIVDVKVYPSLVELRHARDRQQLVVQALLSNGLTVDVTEQVTWTMSDDSIVRIDGATIYPLADGETKLVAGLNDFDAEVTVSCVDSNAEKPVSYLLDVMPVFMVAGCNAGSCHGAARGKDGFILSLYGFDPKGDYHRLTREQVGRRVDLALPDECLLMEKAAGNVPHTGGGPIPKGSEHYLTLKRWLEAGAKIDDGPVPQVVELQLFPPSAVLNGAGSKQQMTARAIYSDGSSRDVTSLVYFSSNNDNSASVSQSGLITAGARGEAFVMGRFDTHTVGIPVIALPKDLEFVWEEVPEHNYVDQQVHAKLKKLRIQPSEICSDEVFIRRVSVDICGLLPTPEEIHNFVADNNPNKRSLLIDELLERKEFVEIWVMKWSELLQIRSSLQVSYKAALLYYNWLQERIANNMPMDQLIQELLACEGGNFSNPATNYYQSERDTLKISENVAQVFLGMRLQCAQCHNHPFDRWTMDDYYSFAAFFTQVGRKAADDPREQIVFNSASGEVRHPVTGQNMPPKFLGGDHPDVRGKDRRAVVAAWIGSKDNPYFARNLANIVWSHFFGRGIVDEVDDVRISNPPSNEELLDALGARFAEYDFDLKQLVRDICNSRTYQLSTQANQSNESDLTNFSRAQLRRIRAEILLDIISQITETQNKFPGLPIGARAVQIADGNTSNYFLTTFGRAQRTSVCSCEVVMEPNLSQALHLINGDSVHEKIKQGGVVARLLEQGKSAEEIITFLYIRCLGREPMESEWEQLKQELASESELKVVLEDIFWALLNSREFVFNH